MPRLLPLLLLALLVACTPRPPDLGPPPNILLLVVDCLRSDHLGVNGYERPTTPSIDALAAESIRFTRTSSQASWTRPSVPTLLTGLYPSEHGLHNFNVGDDGTVESPSLAASVVTVAETLKAAGYRTALIAEQYQLSPRFGLNQGFDFYKHRASDAANIHRNFFRWLDRRPGQKFFAYLHYLEIHWPYCPPPETRGTFNQGRSKIRFCHQWRQLRKDILSGTIVLDDGDRQALEARYDEELLALDARLGELFSTLRERGLWDSTLLVLTSDHGEEFFEHGAIGHGQSLYEELLAIPLFFKPPAAWQATVGREVDAVVEVRDLVPTVLEVAGVPAPEGLNAPSLIPWMVGRRPGSDPHPFVVAEAHDKVVVRSAGLKLIADREGGSFELYDLTRDPRETRNLASERPGDLERMRAYLESWRQSLLPAPEVELREIDAETVEGLKKLGYIDE